MQILHYDVSVETYAASCEERNEEPLAKRIRDKTEKELTLWPRKEMKKISQRSGPLWLALLLHSVVTTGVIGDIMWAKNISGLWALAQWISTISSEWVVGRLVGCEKRLWKLQIFPQKKRWTDWWQWRAWWWRIPSHWWQRWEFAWVSGYFEEHRTKAEIRYFCCTLFLDEYCKNSFIIYFISNFRIS